VDVVEGAVIGGKGIFPSLVGRGQSRVHLFGRDFGDAEGSFIEMHDQSRVIASGTQNYNIGFAAYDHASVQLSNGTISAGMAAYNRAVVRAEGARLDSVNVFENASARIINSRGFTDDIRATATGHSTLILRSSRHRHLVAQDDSAVWFDTGRVTGWLRVNDRAQFHLVGANYDIAEIIEVGDDAALHVYGTDLVYDTDIEGELPTLLGFFPDGRPIRQAVLLEDNARIVFHTVPEPATATTLALGILALAASRRRLTSR